MSSGWPFLVAWRVAPRLSSGVLDSLAAGVAAVACVINTSGVRQLRRNCRRIRGKELTRKETWQATRSYFRCFAEIFQLSAIDKIQLKKRVRLVSDGNVYQDLESGPVSLALTHSGNWDLAGAWSGYNLAPVLTVGERLEPETVFQAFMEHRKRLGMQVIAAEKGKAVFPALVELAQEKAKTGNYPLIPLLADRDITGSGVEVELAGHRALVAPGPAALASRLKCPLYAGHIYYEKLVGKRRKEAKSRWGIVIELRGPIKQCASSLNNEDGSFNNDDSSLKNDNGKSISGPGSRKQDIAVTTQNWVRVIEPVIAEHLLDWHMMQPIFVDDLDPERLARARRKAQDRQEPA